jgi:hypothetical protein
MAARRRCAGSSISTMRAPRVPTEILEVHEQLAAGDMAAPPVSGKGRVGLGPHIEDM